MRVKTLVILAGLLVGLGMLSLARFWFQRSRGPDLPFKKLAPEAIVKVEIRQPTHTVTLELVNNRWELKTPVTGPADELSVKPLLEGLTKLAVGGVLTSRPERHTQFQVTEGSGTLVQVWTTGTDAPALSKAEGPRAAFVIGKSAPEGAGIYLRYKDRKDVHLAEGLASYHLNRTVKDWRDKSILRVNIPDIERVELTYYKKRSASKKAPPSSSFPSPASPLSPSIPRLGSGPAPLGAGPPEGEAAVDAQVTLVKTSDTWRVWVEGTRENGQPADPAKVDSLLATLATLDADDFIDPPQANDLASLGLNPAQLTLNLKAKGQTFTLALGSQQQPSNNFPLRKEGETTIYLIPPYRAESLTKKATDFLPAKK